MQEMGRTQIGPPVSVFGLVSMEPGQCRRSLQILIGRNRSVASIDISRDSYVASVPQDCGIVAVLHKAHHTLSRLCSWQQGARWSLTASMLSMRLQHFDRLRGSISATFELSGGRKPASPWPLVVIVVDTPASPQSPARNLQLLRSLST